MGGGELGLAFFASSAICFGSFGVLVALSISKIVSNEPSDESNKNAVLGKNGGS
jgi:hypothetical protein